MKYTVVVQPEAEADIEAAYLYLSEAASPDLAVRWFNEIDAAMTTLAEFPKRCPRAPEDQYFDDEIRHLLVEPYRVLFTIRAKEVRVLHVRHMARRTLGGEDTEP